jgi:predicted restriction endonuclease
MSNEVQLIDLIAGMGVHGGTSSPAPHKPLLVALVIALRAAQPAGPRLIEYETIEGPLGDLLALAGRARRPWYPFVRMRQESFWEVAGELELNSSGDVARVAELRNPTVRGGFTAEFDAVARDGLSSERTIEALCARWFDTVLTGRVLTLLSTEVSTS